MRIKALPVVPYYNPGDSMIAEELANLAPNYRAYLLANHGPVVTGTSLVDAVDNSEELEETAKLFLILQNQNVAYLSEENVKILTNKGA